MRTCLVSLAAVHVLLERLACQPVATQPHAVAPPLPLFAGFIDLSPVFYRPFVSASIRNMTYPADLMQQLPPLNPMVSLNVRMDSRKGRVAFQALVIHN